MRHGLGQPKESYIYVASVIVNDSKNGIIVRNQMTRTESPKGTETPSSSSHTKTTRQLAPHGVWNGNRCDCETGICTPQMVLAHLPLALLRPCSPVKIRITESRLTQTHGSGQGFVRWKVRRVGLSVSTSVFFACNGSVFYAPEGFKKLDNSGCWGDKKVQPSLLCARGRYGRCSFQTDRCGNFPWIMEDFDR